MKHLITNVDIGSVAYDAGVRTGWKLVAIDGNVIHDVIDYELFTSVEALTASFETAENLPVDLLIEKESWEALGLSFTSGLMSPVRQCANHCVFCFIDQMPRGNRETLYFKDDDWRLSLIMGNYVTLTNVSDAEFKRIIERRVSPLYISVHATDGNVRRQMMRSRNSEMIMQRLTALHNAGLKFHSQIVLCPNLNDGAILRRTLDDLYSLSPDAVSVAIVPVGLTRHRQGLYPLTPLTQAQAKEAIEMVDRFTCDNQADGFAFCSDEMYFRAGMELPPYEFYRDFDQIENGVGLFRLFENGFVDAVCDRSPLPSPARLCSVSGTAIGASMQKLFLQLEAFNIRIENHAVTNTFFGESVTVSGLVTAGDIISQLVGRINGSALLIPSSMLRENDDVFLDGMRVGELSKILGVPVHAMPADDGDAFIEKLFMILEGN